MTDQPNAELSELGTVLVKKPKKSWADVIACFPLQIPNADSTPPPIVGMLSPGIYPIISSTEGGKTTLMKELLTKVRTDPTPHLSVAVPYLEPVVGGLLNLDELHAFLNEHLADHIAFQGSVLFLLDGLRLDQLTAKGNAMKGGYSSGFFYILTELDILCKRRGVVMVAALNPLGRDAEVAAQFQIDVEGSCQGVIVGNWREGWSIKDRHLGRELLPFDLAAPLVKAERRLNIAISDELPVISGDRLQSSLLAREAQAASTRELNDSAFASGLDRLTTPLPGLDKVKPNRSPLARLSREADALAKKVLPGLDPEKSGPLANALSAEAKKEATASTLNNSLTNGNQS